MGKMILSLVLTLALAGSAAALPAGTIYFGGRGSTDGGASHGHYIYYLDLDEYWIPTEDAEDPGSANVVEQIGVAGSSTVSVTQNEYSVNDTSFYGLNWMSDYGAPETWYGADMGGTYHSAQLVMAAYHNDDVLRGSAPAADLITVDYAGYNTAATITVLNDGNGGTTYPSTLCPHWSIPVDSGFTPDGSAKGIVCEAWEKRGTIWTKASDGSFTSYPTSRPGGTSDWNQDTVTYCATNPQEYTIGGQAVYGVLYAGNSGNHNVTTLAYLGNGNYFRSDIAVNTAAWHTVAGGSAWEGLTAGDVDGDGRPDVYGMKRWGEHLYHMEDQNGDGDFDDETDGDYMGNYYNGQANYDYLFDLELVKCEDGSWVLLNFGQNASGYFLRYFVLSSDGTAVEGSPVTLLTSADDPGFASMLYARDITFVPLGEAGSEVPEPGTMLLVGTGVLGLVGALRRRLLS